MIISVNRYSDYMKKLCLLVEKDDMVAMRDSRFENTVKLFSWSEKFNCYANAGSYTISIFTGTFYDELGKDTGCKTVYDLIKWHPKVIKGLYRIDGGKWVKVKEAGR